MQENAANATVLDQSVVVKKCGQCGMEINGFMHDGYLWPSWMLKRNSTKCPPHGPRLYSEQRNKCWFCSIKDGESWHR